MAQQPQRTHKYFCTQCVYVYSIAFVCKMMKKIETKRNETGKQSKSCSVKQTKIYATNREYMRGMQDERNTEVVFLLRLLYNTWQRFVATTSTRIGRQKERKIASRFICQSFWCGSIWKNISCIRIWKSREREGGREKRCLVQSLDSIELMEFWLYWFSKHILYRNHCFSLTLSNLYCTVYTCTHTYTLWDFCLVNLLNAIS